MRLGNCLATLQGLAIVGMLVQSACAGGGGSGNTGAVTTPAQSVSVTLVGVPSAVAPGASVAVSAQVQGASSTAVTWTVDGMANGNASVGTISSTGNAATYTAPANAGNHLLAAISVADPRVSASAQVTVSASAGPVISAVTASSITQTSALISWTLNEVGTGQVFYGLTPAYGSVTTPELSLNYSAHAQNITGLTAGTLYHYCVKSADQAGNLSTSGDYTFTTASATSSNPPASSITSVAVNPTTLTLNPSAQFSFAATVAGTGTFSYGVTWSCLRGAITSGGLYTAPSAAGSDTVTATSAQDGTKKGTSSVTVSSSGSVSGSVPSGTSVKSVPYNAYGDGVHDDTAAIQACINAVAGTGGTVIVPAGTFMINPVAASGGYGITLGSNMTLYLSSGAVLQAITNSQTNYAIVGMTGINNATVTGPGMISGDRATHTGTTGEWGMGIYVGNTVATNCTISNIIINNCWGDGIYVYETSSNTNLTIANVICDNNRRQGLSIINVNGMTVTGSTFSNTQGTGPECGIDIEPNGGQFVNNVNINHCTLTGNHGGGFQSGAATNTTITNITIDSNTINANGFGTRSPLDAGGPSGILVEQSMGATSYTNGIHITNNTITGNANTGIAFSTCAYVTVTGNTISGSTNFSGTTYTGTGIYLWDTNAILMTGNTITTNATWGIWDLGNDGAVPNPVTGINYNAGTSNTATPNTYSGNGSGNYKSGS